MSHSKPMTIRSDDLLRHLHDLRTGTYEGVQTRKEKEELYMKGIELLTPVAIAILEEANNVFLQRTGEIRVVGPKENGSGELETRFELSWPEQQSALNRHASREPLKPVCIIVNYSQNFLHPHLSGSTAGHWPFQVTSEADAERQKGILSAIVELELHQRIFETDWRILPVSKQVRVD